MLIPDHQLPDEYLREIGRVAVEWSRLELAIEAAIWALLFCDPDNITSPWFKETEGRAITTHINPLLRIDMLLSLASTALPQSTDLPNRLSELAKQVRAAYPKRNRVVHGLWEPFGQNTLRRTYRARGEVTPFHDVVSLGDISAVSAETAALTLGLSSFIDDLVPALRLLPALHPRLKR